MTQTKPVFVTGATGYIGGRLVPRLLEAGYQVRCYVRSPKKLQDNHWLNHERVDVVRGNISDIEALTDAMRGCGAAYYLVHSMLSAGKSYAQHDRKLAENFSRAARDANIERIIYLGGLGEVNEDLSEHLASRRNVGEALAEGSTPVTILRAAMIIGSGSASFEILRYLVERLPIMITPRWVSTRCQPIGVRNVISYLVKCLDTPETIGKTLDIGGPDILTYKEMMRVMAQERQLSRRLILPVPVLTPKLSSLWIALVTPLNARIARPLAEGLRNEVVCRGNQARELMEQELFSVREAINAALGKVQAGQIETAWSDAGVMPSDPDWAGGTVYVDRRSRDVAASAEATYQAVCRVGGGEGYYGADWLWWLRGVMDQLVGGPGLRRGRREPERIGFGDALDFWRVTGIEPNRYLNLRAEMKLPGKATLSFEIEDSEESPDRCTLIQTARFKPKGLFGLIYWYAVLPLHNIVFNAMLTGICRKAKAIESTRDSRQTATNVQ